MDTENRKEIKTMGDWLIDEKAIGNYLVQIQGYDRADGIVLVVTLSKTENGSTYETVLSSYETTRAAAYDAFNNYIEVAELNTKKGR